jgi:putative serine/threonine protein kinase
LEQISVDEFGRTPYLNVLTYPKPNLRVAKRRIAELKALGVNKVIFEGRTRIGRLGLLGIGTVGLVVKVETGGVVRALKIRRTDANRESMDSEHGLTLMANKVGVGPLVVSATRDFLLMEWVRGEQVDDWLAKVQGAGARAKLRDLIHSILNQCRKMDILNLDHGQLSNLRKHVLIDEDRPTIIDFESASLHRKSKNVTTAAQYLLVGGKVSKKVRTILGMKKVDPVLKALSLYKREMSDESYASLLHTFGIPLPVS